MPQRQNLFFVPIVIMLKNLYARYHNRSKISFLPYFANIVLQYSTRFIARVLFIFESLEKCDLRGRIFITLD